MSSQMTQLRKLERQESTFSIHGVERTDFIISPAKTPRTYKAEAETLKTVAALIPISFHETHSVSNFPHIIVMQPLSRKDLELNNLVSLSLFIFLEF
ncbi:hypothetical protein PoB_007054600 [Plakobranchus ocellatus]|uniref:Uncharacterized protein n=1 Tax=Plakobranchus ocellatus TaxID=259542 RepID=A0AAV4DJJ9_9GAST|nr:hypothetical protein PoB_007054600 [Plakobranchus ocellatus]